MLDFLTYYPQCEWKVNTKARGMSRARDLSGSVARHLSGCHSAPKGVRNDADASATGDSEDEIRGSV